VIADPTVLEVVHVRAADADGADLDEHLSRAGIRDRALLDHTSPGACITAATLGLTSRLPG
jgi:hypothetical protein